MKKFAILFALFAAMGAAQADVNVFGTMDAGYNSSKAPDASSATTDYKSGGMSSSHIGFKGGENLDNGSKVFFEISSFLDNGTGATKGGSTVNTWARSSFVGLSDDTFGKVTLGRQSNPSFLPTILFNAYGDSGAYSPLWHATYFGNTGNNMTQLYNDTAWDNSISYSTPNIGGAVVTVQNAKGTGAQNVGANVLYFKGDLGLMAYHQKTDVNSTGSFQTNIFANNSGSSAVATGVGASYDFHVAKLFATYQKAEDDVSNQRGKTAQVSALIPVGKGNVMAEYAHTSTHGASTAEYREYAVGYDYYLSKKTDIYATVGRTDVTDKSQGQTLGAGIRVRF